MDKIDKIKEILLSEYPNSKFVQDIIDCRYGNDILYMKLSDGQRAIYVVDGGELIVFKQNTMDFGVATTKAKKIMRELKLMTLINDEGNS